jgi:hypothetical protein
MIKHMRYSLLYELLTEIASHENSSQVALKPLKELGVHFFV